MEWNGGDIMNSNFMIIFVNENIWLYFDIWYKSKFGV